VEPRRISVNITFLSASEGGRQSPPDNLSSGQYRPHLVVGDPDQRQAVTVDNEVKETYLGVVFVDGPESVAVGEPFIAELILIYWPNTAYESLVPGATFTTARDRASLAMEVFSHLKKTLAVAIVIMMANPPNLLIRNKSK
jgi:hypothetical protein